MTAAALMMGTVACQSAIKLETRYLVVDRDASSCLHREPPAPPLASGVGGSLEFVLALQSYEVGAGTDDAGRPRSDGIGFDLDHTCTGEGQGPSCVEPKWATADHNDGVDGIDNAYGRAVYSYSSDPTPASSSAAELLIRIRAYSGGSDDDEVEVCLLGALGLTPRADRGVGPFGDGEDRWTVLPETLVPSADGGTPSAEQPQSCDEHAYVSAGTLVARFAQVQWPAALPLAPWWMVWVHQLVLSGRLVNAAGTWELDDAVAGFRVPVKEALVWGARLALPTKQPICSQPTNYAQVKQTICSLVDIASGTDSPTSQCDADSEGIAFQARQARLGEVAPPSPPLPPCTGVDPENDSCDNQ
jgi:hypothetical protein